MTTPNWSIECDYMETCNCDFGCACNFNGLPNFGRCEALVGYHIRDGHFGTATLDNLDFVYAASWPRASGFELCQPLNPTQSFYSHGYCIRRTAMLINECPLKIPFCITGKLGSAAVV